MKSRPNDLAERLREAIDRNFEEQVAFLARMVQFHIENKALATIAVQDRATSRYLLFDQANDLCGRRLGIDGTVELVRGTRDFNAYAFSGIHVISPRFLPMLSEEGVFSIITSYLRLAGTGEKVRAFRADAFYWRDLGKPENVIQAQADTVWQR